MRDIWFISDLHLGHDNILKFLDDQGQVTRPFSSLKEMEDCILTNWNERVKPNDIVYNLGDFCWGNAEKAKRYADQLHGLKRLVLGNHDDVKKQKLGDCFKKIMVWRLWTDFNFVCTHIPLHPGSFRKVEFNVHGHIHHRESPSDAYLNVCVEKTGYKPLHLDEIRETLAKRSVTYGESRY